MSDYSDYLVISPTGRMATISRSTSEIQKLAEILPNTIFTLIEENDQ